jgi:PilZ domain
VPQPHEEFAERFDVLSGLKGTHEGALPTPDTMADRRIAPRYPVILIAQVRDLNGEKKFNARTSDLSRTGCYVDTLTPLPKGSSMRITLMRFEEIFEATGTVMYVSPGLGMGVRFEEPLPRDQIAVLESWLQRTANQRE